MELAWQVPVGLPEADRPIDPEISDGRRAPMDPREPFSRAERCQVPIGLPEADRRIDPKISDGRRAPIDFPRKK